MCKHIFVLSLRDVSYTYGDGTEALRNVTMDVPRGYRIAFLGANGAGKSTLFLLMNGILKPGRGELFLDGKQVKHKQSFLHELRREVGYVFQDPECQLFAPTVYQEVSFDPMNLGFPEDEIGERIESALKDTETVDLKDKHTQFLSYGQKKRASVADVIAMKSSIFLMDEPLDCLDTRQKSRMTDLLNRLHRNGKTVLLSTHDIDFAYSWADQVVIMKEGSIAAQGDPYTVFSDKDLLDSTSLIRPMVMDIYEFLRDSGIIETKSEPPRTRTELMDLISDTRHYKEAVNET